MSDEPAKICETCTHFVVRPPELQPVADHMGALGDCKIPLPIWLKDDPDMKLGNWVWEQRQGCLCWTAKA